MIVTNLTSDTLFLPFANITISPNGIVTISDSYLVNPQFKTYLNNKLISVSQTDNQLVTSLINSLTENQKKALDAALDAGQHNPYVTEQRMLLEFEEHIKKKDAHHSNANDLTTPQRDGIVSLQGLSVTNPLLTQTQINNAISAAISAHITALHSTPLTLTPDEINAINNANTPSALNVFITNSVADAKVNSGISTHTSNATAHHSNANDPSTDQKLAMNAANAPNAGNPFSTIDDLNTHAANATAHHSNANDPSPNQKAALNANINLNGTNYVVDTTYFGLLNVSQKAAITNAVGTPGAGNPFVLSSDPRLAASSNLTTDQKDSLDANGALNASNAVVGSNDARLLTSVQKLGIDNTSPAITGTNTIVTVNSSLILSSIIRDALNNTSGTPSVSNFFVLNDDSRLTGLSNLPSTDQKASLNANGTLNAGNPVAGQNDPRFPSLDQKAGFDSASPAITGINPVVTVNNPIFSNTPSNDQKAGFDAASPAITGLNPVVTENNTLFTNLPSNDQKASFDANGNLNGTNYAIDNSDSRLSDARTPLSHASNHTNGTDDIQNASSSQKGLMTSMVYDWLLNTRRHINDVYLKFTSTTSITIYGTGTKSLFINDEEVDFFSNKILNITDNVLNSDGTDSGASMAASTLYYIYASNSQASYAPLTVRGSSTAPTYINSLRNDYLNTSGNALNWLHIGYVQINGSTLITDKFSVISEYNEPDIVGKVNNGLAATGPNASANVYYDVTGTTQSVLIPANGYLIIHFGVSIQGNSGATCDVAVQVDSDPEEVEIEVVLPSSGDKIDGYSTYLYYNALSVPAYKTFKLRYKFDTVNAKNEVDPSFSNYIFSRNNTVFVI